MAKEKGFADRDIVSSSRRQKLENIEEFPDLFAEDFNAIFNHTQIRLNVNILVNLNMFEI